LPARSCAVGQLGPNVRQQGRVEGGRADTALWREHLHAATMVGRVAAARVAVELGYAIEADAGPSGRLRHWRIAGFRRRLWMFTRSGRRRSTPNASAGRPLLAGSGGGRAEDPPGQAARRGGRTGGALAPTNWRPSDGLSNGSRRPSIAPLGGSGRPPHLR
jgi:hypothetical protein